MAQAHAVSGQMVGIHPLGESIRATRTTALIKADQLEVVRVVLLAGHELREHRAPGEITVLCIEGRVEFSTPDGTLPMAAGDWIHLRRREPHALRALDDASLLLTMCIDAPGGD
jgi:quercetin dioxygenase-like cupin family protein